MIYQVESACRAGIECVWTEYCMVVCGYWNADEGAALRHGTFQQKNGMTYAMFSCIQKLKLSGSEKRAFSRWAKLYSEEIRPIFELLKPILEIVPEASENKKIVTRISGGQRQRLMIAHRLSTIRQCDRILVMDEGKVIEDGTYEELISQNGFFADHVKRQTI